MKSTEFKYYYHKYEMSIKYMGINGIMEIFASIGLLRIR